MSFVVAFECLKIFSVTFFGSNFGGKREKVIYFLLLGNPLLKFSAPHYARYPPVPAPAAAAETLLDAVLDFCFVTPRCPLTSRIWR
jgi:hypothetical protein